MWYLIIPNSPSYDPYVSPSTTGLEAVTMSDMHNGTLVGGRGNLWVKPGGAPEKILELKVSFFICSSFSNPSVSGQDAFRHRTESRSLTSGSAYSPIHNHTGDMRVKHLRVLLKPQQGRKRDVSGGEM